MCLARDDGFHFELHFGDINGRCVVNQQNNCICLLVLSFCDISQDTTMCHYEAHCVDFEIATFECTFFSSRYILMQIFV